MEMLMLSPKIFVTTEKIMTHIWGWDGAADTSVVWVHISNLRKKIESLSAPITIRFIRNAGYILEEK